MDYKYVISGNYVVLYKIGNEYGDIYPVTTLGKLFGIFIAFLGIGIVAISTGIISVRFVDQYSNIKKRTEFGYEVGMNFIKVFVDDNDPWVGKQVADLDILRHSIIVLVKRKNKALIPNGNMLLKEGDRLFMYTQRYLKDANEFEI